MKKEINTKVLLDYIETYNKYEYLIDKIIMKICPEYIDNEDFVQDAKLGLLEYIEHNECFNKLNTCSSRTSYISKYIYAFILRLYKKYTYNGMDSILYLYDSNIIFTDTSLDNIDIIESINNALNKLTEREAKIIRLRFYENLTLDNIAKLEGITANRIQQIIKKALRKLRHPYRSKGLKAYIED